ncbi:MAG: beta-L-arabinofuranosidase domain-containing protein [Flavitalea sp.]
MRMFRLPANLLLVVIAILGSASFAKAQGGDQILDGIGETGMVARYLFNGDLKDWSRNNLHGQTNASNSIFVNDNRFGKVLSLSGGPNDFITLPTETLFDLESMSISGWIQLRSKQQGQKLFDFGEDEANRFFLAPSGLAGKDQLNATLASSKEKTPAATSTPVELNKWVHVVVVIDVSSKSLTTYIDSKQAGEVKNIPIELNDIFGNQPAENKLYIGKSLNAGDPNLNALLYDFRIYRVPLSGRQVAGIYGNAKGSINSGSVNTRGKKEEDVLPKFGADERQLYNAYLVKVADVKVETETGNLPRLPAYVDGVYKNGFKGPRVRIIWPADIDNAKVLKQGKDTIVGRVAGTNFQPKAFVTIKNGAGKKSPALKLKTFALNEVMLKNDAHNHESKFIENRNKFVNTLARTDPNSFLYMFRHAFGQPQPEGAKPLGVWDSKDTKLRGHATGHYLTAIAQAYAGTGYDKTLQQNFAGKMDTMVNTLYELAALSGKANSASSFVSDPSKVPFGPGKTAYDSDLSDEGIRNDYWNWGKGFISAYPPDQFIMLENGAKYGGQKNAIWAPYYTLHKIMAGLMDVYEVSKNQKAIDVASGMGEWVYARLSKVPTDTLIKMWNTYIAGEFGGMNEAMARLYRLTGKADFLKTAQLFDNIRVFYGDTAHVHGLAKNVDLFRGLHANQHIPQIVGSIEMYRVSNNPEYYKIADNFWYKAITDYSYSIGGIAGARNPANAECFIAQPATIYENGFSSGGQNETCGTYNMLKLTSDLFLYDQKPEYMDYYERALYNHILASVAEKTPANTYHVPLRPGSVKQFGNPDMTGFTCCNGTAIESSTKLQNSIYFKSADDQALYVNLYVPSTLQWTKRNIIIEQTTSFPNEDNTKLTVKGNGKFNLNVRVPSWATKGFFVKINGKEHKVAAKAGSYLKISRTWKDGDIIELRMPFTFHLDPVMDQQNIASLFYGPILLAAQEPAARKDWRQVTLDAADLSKSIKGDASKLEFSIDEVIFKPFYETYGRHSVYLDVRFK